MATEFRDYVTPSGANPVQRWLSKQPRAVRAEFTALTANLAPLSRHLWTPREWAPLKGKYRREALYELRVKLGKNDHYRLGGFAGPDPNWITFFAGWGHAAGDEKRGYENTLARKKLLVTGRGSTVEHV